MLQFTISWDILHSDGLSCYVNIYKDHQVPITSTAGLGVSSQQRVKAIRLCMSHCLVWDWGIFPIDYLLLNFVLFQGKQAKIKEMYEQSVLQSEQGNLTKYIPSVRLENGPFVQK